MPLAEAYQAAGQVMADNMLFPDTQEGIDAFMKSVIPTGRNKRYANPASARSGTRYCSASARMFFRERRRTLKISNCPRHS